MFINSSDGSDEDVGTMPKSVSAFALLAVDSNDEVDSEEEVVTTNGKGKQGKPTGTTKNDVKEKLESTSNTKQKKKKGKRKDEDDEDLDKMLAELELEYSGAKKPEEIKAPVAAEVQEVKEGIKKKNKKDKLAEETESTVIEAKEETKPIIQEEETPVADVADVEADVDKKKKKKKKKAGQESDSASNKEPDSIAKESDAAAEGNEENVDDKKTKKGKKKLEDNKKDKKGPGKKALVAMQETLKKIKVRKLVLNGFI